MRPIVAALLSLSFCCGSVEAQNPPPGVDVYLNEYVPDGVLWYSERSQCAVISDPRPDFSGQYYQSYVMLEEFDRIWGLGVPGAPRRMTIVTSSGVAQHVRYAGDGDSGNVIVSRDGRSVAYTTDYNTRMLRYSNDFGQTFVDLPLPGVPGYQGAVVVGSQKEESHIFGNMAFDSHGNLYVFYLRLRTGVVVGQSNNTAKLFGAIIDSNGNLAVPPLQLADIQATYGGASLFPSVTMSTVSTEGHIVLGMNVGPGYNDGVSPNLIPNKGWFFVVNTNTLQVSTISWGGSDQAALITIDGYGAATTSSLVSDGRSIFMFGRNGFSGGPGSGFRYWVRKFDPNPSNPYVFFPNTATGSAAPYMDIDSPLVPPRVEIEEMIGHPIRASITQPFHYLVTGIVAPWRNATYSGGELVVMVDDALQPLPGQNAKSRRVRVSGFNTGGISTQIEDVFDISDHQIHNLGLTHFPILDFQPPDVTLLPYRSMTTFGPDVLTSFCRNFSGNIGPTFIKGAMFGMDLK